MHTFCFIHLAWICLWTWAGLQTNVTEFTQYFSLFNENPAIFRYHCCEWEMEVFAQNLTIQDLVHPLFNTDPLSCPLCRKVAPMYGPENHIKKMHVLLVWPYNFTYQTFIYWLPKNRLADWKLFFLAGRPETFERASVACPSPAALLNSDRKKSRLTCKS